MADNNLKVIISGEDKLSAVLLAATAQMEKMSQSTESLSKSAATMAAAMDKAGKTTGDSIKKGTEEAKGGILDLAKGFALGQAAVEGAKKIFELFNDTLHKSIEEALEAEKAQRILTGALVNTGKYTQENIDVIDEYVKKTELATGASGEWIQETIASGLQMGLTVQKAKELAEASQILANATGKDLTEASSILQSTLAGQSRALGKILPETKDLTAAQLKNGDALAIVTKGLKAQSDLYAGSFEQNLKRAQNNFSNILEGLGKLIISNDLVKKSLAFVADQFAIAAKKVEDFSDWVSENQDTIARFGTALVNTFKVAGIAIAAWGVIAAAAAIPTLTLAGALAAVNLPLVAVVAAVAAVTAAFYKWPGLFDIISGAIKVFVATFAEGIAAMLSAAGKVASIVNDNLGKSITSASQSVLKFSDDLGTSAVAQIEAGQAANKLAAETDATTVAHKEEKKALDEKLLTQNAAVVANKALGQSYGGIIYASKEVAKALELEKSTRDDDLKNFKEYIDNKTALAISKTQEETLQVAKIRAEALTSTSGAGKVEDNTAAIAAEEKRVAGVLAVQQKLGISEQAMDQERLASRQNIRMLELDSALAYSNQRAALLGETEEAQAIKLNNDKVLFEQKLAMQQEQFLLLGGTEAEFAATRTEAEDAFRQSQIDADVAFYENRANARGKEVTSFAQMSDKLVAEQKKRGVVLGTLQGISDNVMVQGTAKATGEVAKLMSSGSKVQFEIGKKAAIAQATIQTYQGAVSAYTSLASIPFVGPVLGAAAAAAAVAAGVANIQKINSQQFGGGGQADEGMDSIPQGLAGKSFVLSQGERVVQPAANADLKDFLNREKMGTAKAGGGGGTYNITLNYSGAGSQADAAAMADMVIKEIRLRSERGQVIMNPKGLG